MYLFKVQVPLGQVNLNIITDEWREIHTVSGKPGNVSYFLPFQCLCFFFYILFGVIECLQYANLNQRIHKFPPVWIIWITSLKKNSVKIKKRWKSPQCQRKNLNVSLKDAEGLQKGTQQLLSRGRMWLSFYSYSFCTVFVL